jgi:acetyl-CoA C-acetyltransferase
MREVAIIGVGMTKFGELWDKSLRDLIVEAGLEAINDAGITSNDIDALYGGCMSAGQFISQEHVAALITDFAGLSRRKIPATRVEAACASGGVALREGYLAVASGMYDIVVVGGVEKMTDVDEDVAAQALATASDQEWEAFFGLTFPAVYALIARRHMYEYGTTREQLAQVAVKNHRNAKLNFRAQYKRELKLEQVLKAPYIAEPLTMLDCAPISDGAAAVVLCALEKATTFKAKNKIIKILGSGQASDSLALHSREDLCKFDSTIEAANQAYRQAKIKPKDIDLAEVHDCFTIAEILALEDLGFVEKGKGGKFTEEGKTTLEGELPINTSGGLKACGNPVGATGIAQVVEIVTQLRGEASQRQVKNVKIGLTHNVGGSGATSVVHIFGVL